MNAKAFITGKLQRQQFRLCAETVRRFMKKWKFFDDFHIEEKAVMCYDLDSRKQDRKGREEGTMINSKHKDRLFSFIFGREENKQWTLELYNAVNGSDYTEPEEIEITTIEDILYMGMKNDLSFILHCRMSIYEQNSTWCPNIPVRELMYAGKLYDKYIHQNRLNIYGKKLITLPAPRLICFYNGTDDKEDEVVLQLKDAFPKGLKRGADISVRVRMLNINKGRNKEIMKACGPLEEYAWLVEAIRANKRNGMEIEDAVDAALDAMPERYSIREFLMENRAEGAPVRRLKYRKVKVLSRKSLANSRYLVLEP